jgi:membrane-associated phospholipid phosphatase
MRALSLCSLVLASGWLFAGGTEPAALIPEASSKEASSKVALMASPMDPDRFPNLPRLLLDDAGHVLHAAGSWGHADWATAWTGAAVVLGTGLLLDHSVDQTVVRNAIGSTDRMAKLFENLGGPPSVLIAGGIYLGGIAFKDPEVRATGIDTMVTMGVAQLMIALPLKLLVGRSRPYTDQGTHDFHPLTGGQSFPSSHTIQAFSLASVISAHAEQPWVTGLSYGLAGLVGLSRVEQRQHFMSDVVASAVIGTFVGRTVVAHNQALRADARSKVTVSFAPMVGPGSYGFSLTAKF